MQTAEQNRQRAKTWYQDNHEKAKEYRIRKQAKETSEGREKRIAYGREYYKTNKETILTRQKEYLKNLDNRDIRTARAKERIRNEPMARIKRMVSSAKARANNVGMRCTIIAEDFIPLPLVCPLLGIRISWDGVGRGANSPSIDRIDSSKGYTKENTIIVSWRANWLKNNGTLNEFQTLVRNLAVISANNMKE